VIETSVIVVSTLWVMSTRQLRFAALGLLAQFAAANALSSSAVPRNVVVLLGVAALAAVVVIYVAARDSRFGEDPGWRVWPGMAIAAVATVLAFAVFSSPEVDRFLQVSAFWLLCAGMSVLLTARTSVRMVIGALLMLSGTQLVLRFAPGAQLGITLVFAWVELLLALAGAFLVINQRALEER
jgi:hypothetical protein